MILKNVVRNSFKNPVVWFALIMILVSFSRISKNDNLSRVVFSDGRGYYAYLPSLFIYNDNSFQKTIAAEQNHFGENDPQLYLYKDKQGKVYNKYFPGIAVLQLPFFCIACIVSWITDSPIDGYSAIFLFCFYVGSLFYSVAGMLLFNKSVALLFPEVKPKMVWLVPLIFIATPLFYYTINTPSYSHLYSFFLFGLLTYEVLKWKINPGRSGAFFRMGLIIGLISLVRPTNAVVVLTIPFILGDMPSLKAFLSALFSPKAKKLIALILGFSAILSLLFFLWKWQSGNWIIWSYSGEGFNFFSPQFFTCLFSFRIGLFLQIPIMFLAMAGLWFLLRENKFKALFWSLYLVLNCWIFSSWWCWDFESPFGSRPYTEHLFFLLMPVFVFVNRLKLVSIVSLSVLSVIGAIRYYEIDSGFMTNQRFTKENYFKSLAFWKSENNGRWNFTRSCEPFGKKIHDTLLLNTIQETEINAIEFSQSAEIKLDKPRTNERMYVSVELEKKITDKLLSGVFLVIDASNETGDKRFYKAIELFNDRFEGKSEWCKLIFEEQIYDNFQEYSQVKIYIWNPEKKKFHIQKMKTRLMIYKQ